jgi:hypothetical protein
MPVFSNSLMWTKTSLPRGALALLGGMPTQWSASRFMSPLARTGNACVLLYCSTPPLSVQQTLCDLTIS